MPKVKICCIASIKEAKLAIKYGASAVGLVSEMPSGPGVIDETLIAEIADSIPRSMASLLLTRKQDTKSIIEQQKRSRVNTLQLCDRIIDGEYTDFRDVIPNINIVQVIHVTGDESVEEAIAISHLVDAILLDSGNQNLSTRELGGTGRTHNWRLSRTIVESVDKPVWLAGGLNPQNVIEAIESVSPYGVDLCSGVRTNDKLDESKLSEFMTIIKETD